MIVVWIDDQVRSHRRKYLYECTPRHRAAIKPQYQELKIELKIAA